MATHSIFLPGEFHARKSLAGSSPEGHRESEVTLWQQAGTHSLPPTSAVPRQALVCLACEALKGMSNSARRVILKQNTVMVS